jgi:hypothetical protein
MPLGARLATHFGVTNLLVYRSPSGATVGRLRSLPHGSRFRLTVRKERCPCPRTISDTGTAALPLYARFDGPSKAKTIASLALAER